MEKLHILGCGSALPASGRNPTAQILEHSGRYFLIDCGEGTQSRLRERKISFDKITDVFISHLHGDHYLGLPGLLCTMQLLGRKKALNIYCPDDLIQLLKFQFKVSKTVITYPLFFHAIESEQLLFTTDKISVSTIALNHRIKCFGFKFQELPKPKRINGVAAKEAGVPHYFMSKLRDGEDFVSEHGELYLNHQLTLPPKPSYCYAFCSDNRIKEGLAEQLQDVDVLYHEATFLHKELDKAIKTFHSTVQEVVELTNKLNLKKLILGHFSARYKDTFEIEVEASSLGSRVLVANDRLVVDFSKL